MDSTLLYGLMADVVLILHFAFVAFVVVSVPVIWIGFLCRARFVLVYGGFLLWIVLSFVFIRPDFRRTRTGVGSNDNRFHTACHPFACFVDH